MNTPEKILTKLQDLLPKPSKNQFRRCKKGIHLYKNNKCIACGKEFVPAKKS